MPDSLRSCRDVPRDAEHRKRAPHPGRTSFRDMEKTTRKTVVCDIDDTVSAMGPRRALLQSTPVDWKRFYEDPFDDEPIQDNCDAVARLLGNGVAVLFSTSRQECCRERTLRWLRTHISAAITDGMLLMRPDDCDLPEPVQKVEGVLSRVAASDIALVIDDNDAILSAWEARGVQTIAFEAPAQGNARTA